MLMQLLVKQITHEARDIVSLWLAAPGGGILPDWEPGAHIDVLRPDGTSGQYSLCAPPGSAMWRIGVLFRPGGRGGARHLHHGVRVGDLLTVEGPRNQFPIKDAAGYLFIAGGIGITPILPMLHKAKAGGRPWHLSYGGRSRETMAYIEEIASLGGSVDLVPEDERGLLQIGPLVDRYARANAVYCCGPEPMIAAVEAAMAGRSLPPPQTERFQPRAVQGGAQRSAFRVRLARRNVSLVVGADESILEALERSAIPVPSSCREGTCGACETRVLAGEIEHLDAILGAQERQEGKTMMICCSRARSPDLLLDL